MPHRRDEALAEVQRAASVAEHVYALSEPWRGRFLDLIARSACDDRAGDQPSEEQVLVWLCDEELNEQIRLMLRSWTHAG